MGGVPVSTLGPQRRCIVRSHVVWTGSKQIISTSDGLELLQMISEPSYGRCASENVGSPKEVYCEIPRCLDWVTADNTVDLSCYK